MKDNNWIEYPEHDKAWIGWETESSYLIHKIKNITNEEGETSANWLSNQLKTEWILKTDFKYKIKNKL